MNVDSLLIVGATGLVGGEGLRQSLADRSVARVVVVTRRPVIIGASSRVPETHVVEFERLADHADAFAVSHVFCALGTTIRAAGSRARFRRVDFDYPLKVARLARERGARHFLLVSAIGADANSRVFYNRVKGELEEAVRALDYPSLTIVRPSLLIGDRPEFRIGEEVARRVAWAVPGRWKPVPARAVAASLLDAAHRAAPGEEIIESDVLRRH